MEELYRVNTLWFRETLVGRVKVSSVFWAKWHLAALLHLATFLTPGAAVYCIRMNRMSTTQNVKPFRHLKKCYCSVFSSKSAKDTNQLTIYLSDALNCQAFSYVQTTIWNSLLSVFISYDLPPNSGRKFSNILMFQDLSLEWDLQNLPVKLTWLKSVGHLHHTQKTTGKESGTR